MKPAVWFSEFLLSIFLCASGCLPAHAQSEASTSPAAPSSAAMPSENLPSASSPTIAIPGPLRSFLRMAAISQKASPEEVLPLLSSNVVVEGYNSRERSRKPTEYMILLKRYVEQARELVALAGPEGVIRISNCDDAQPLLGVLGYRLREPCGPNTSVVADDPQRAFLTIDSGFPLEDLEETMRGGKPFVHTFPSSQVPVLFGRNVWTANSTDKKKSQDDLLDSLLDDPALARLYWALARIDGNTREFLRQSPGLGKLVPVAPVLDFYGSHICIRGGKVIVPGGTSAESAWKNLVRTSPSSPGKFVLQLLSKDNGWLAAYFDALCRVDRTQQDYFTQPRRLQRFYEALRGENISPSAARPVFRPNPGLLLLVTRLQLEPGGQPRVPGNLEVWKEILRRKSESKVVREWGERASHWNNPEQLVEGMFALSRVISTDGPLQVYLELSEMDRRRSPAERLSPQTVRVLAENFPRFKNQYLIFSEFYALNNASLMRFLNVAQALDRIPDHMVRADAIGIFQANVGLWQILARQGQIPKADWNESWQRVINPFAGVLSSPQLFESARTSLVELRRNAAGKPYLSQDEIIALLAGPPQTSAEGQEVRKELAGRIQSVLTAQRLVSLDTLFALGNGLNQMAQGKAVNEGLIRKAGELREFEMPKPIFTRRERTEWASGLYNNPHTESQMRTDLAEIMKSPRSPKELAQARGLLVPFLRDDLVGLNYAYYEPPGAQMLLNNPLFVRSHDFSGEMTLGGEQVWQTPYLFGRGWTASGGAHLAGSLADLPYVLAQVEQDFIVPENVQSLIWEDLVPALVTDAVLPRWWAVSRNELHAVTLHQRFGEELLTAASENEKLRQKVMDILSDRMLPRRSEQVEEVLRAGSGERAVSLLAPAETFYLAAEFRRRFPEEATKWGKSGQELEALAKRYPQEVRWERLSEDFGAPHPALAHSYGRELLNVKPFPTFLGYSSRLLAECWDSDNLYWARLADEMGYSPVMLHRLVPELTHRMVEKIFATHLEDWPAVLRALRETGEEFREGKIVTVGKTQTASGL